MVGLLQGCKWHGGGVHLRRMRCPFCLVLPCLTVLQKISNHLELVKGESEVVLVLLVVKHLFSLLMHLSWAQVTWASFDSARVRLPYNFLIIEKKQVAFLFFHALTNQYL